MLTINFQMFKVDLEKAEEPEFILRIIQEVREFQGRGRLVGFRLWGHTESDMTEVT